MRYALLFFLFLVTACGGEDPGNSLHGDWIWVKSTGGIAGVENTPQSTGVSRSLNITADSLIFFQDGARVSGFAYTMAYGASIFSSQESLQLITPGYNYSIELNGGSLYLWEECNDCFGHVYSKGSD